MGAARAFLLGEADRRTKNGGETVHPLEKWLG